MEKKVIEALKELGVPFGNKGFRYLITAITEVLVNESAIDNMTKKDGVYDVVANAHNTTISKAERSIRHGIQCIFEKTDNMVFIEKYFGYQEEKICNSDFIAGVAYAIRVGN